MVRQTDIQHVDGWRLQIGATGYDVEQAATIMCRCRHATQQTVSSQHICELPRRRVIGAVQADVEIADEENWVDVRHYTVLCSLGLPRAIINHINRKMWSCP